LAYLTNGVMRDERAFHIDQPDWITKYNQQGNIILALHEESR
jgi:stress-induced-phosphoprotein 1